MKRVTLLVVLALLSPNIATAQPAADEPPSVEGVWAQKLVTSTVTDVPVVGDVVSQTVSFQRFKIEQSGEQLQMVEETCDVTIRSDQSAVRTEIPDQFVSSINPVQRTGELRELNGDYYLFAPRKTKLFGVELDDPSDELPEDPDDPRVIDQDNDGNPGMTVEVSGLMSGELYVVQRSWDQLWGQLVEADKIGGLAAWDTDQKVVARSGRIFGEISGSDPHPDEEQSYFRMIRVDESVDCSEIAEKRDALF